MKKIILTAIFLTATTNINAASVDSLTITGGTFSLRGSTLNTIIPAQFADLTVGGYDGFAPVSGDLNASSIATTTFNEFGPIAIYTSPSDGSLSGFSPVTGDITDGVLTLDLSSWTAWWNGSSFNQGSRSDLGETSICATFNCTTAIVIDSFNTASGDFSAHWDAVNIGGAANDILYSWAITGNVSAVPVPAAVWLFGSGLIGLVGVARRKKT